MVGERHRLTTPTLAILEEDGHRLPIMIPLGGIVQVVSGPPNQDRLVDVEWEGRRLLMFIVDLRDRGERVNDDEDT